MRLSTYGPSVARAPPLHLLVLGLPQRVDRPLAACLASSTAAGSPQAPAAPTRLTGRTKRRGLAARAWAKMLAVKGVSLERNVRAQQEKMQQLFYYLRKVCDRGSKRSARLFPGPLQPPPFEASILCPYAMRRANFISRYGNEYFFRITNVRGDLIPRLGLFFIPAYTRI